MSEEQPEQELPPMGRLAFEQYVESMGGVTYDGRGIPPWHALGDEVQHAWDQAARRLYVLGFTAGSKPATLFGKDMTPQQRALLDAAIAYAAGEGRVDALYEAVNALEQECICGTPGMGDFEGPLRDCPVHGELEQPEASYPPVTVILRPEGLGGLFLVEHQIRTVPNTGLQHAVPAFNLSVEVRT